MILSKLKSELFQLHVLERFIVLDTVTPCFITGNFKLIFWNGREEAHWRVAEFRETL